MGYKTTSLFLGLMAALTFTLRADTTNSIMYVPGEMPKDPYFAAFHPKPGPEPKKHFLKEGDRLAIIGDSITEQRKYSRIIETYLTVCVPELNITVRQYGWSGERAPGFLARMTNDCLRFKPTVATTCYGMNDHEYRRYEDHIGAVYLTNQTAIVEAFKANGTRVVLGSPGCVGKKAGWSRDTNATMTDLDLNLCNLRNIDVAIAKKEHVAFADVFWPMFVEDFYAKKEYGPNYALCGRDGVHPDWAGHVVMAYAFLRAMGLDGDIGTFNVDLKSSKAQLSPGHEMISFRDGELKIVSRRYPFCVGDGDVTQDNNIHSGTTLVPFDAELNRLMLVVKHASAKSYKVTWGDASKSFTSKQLAKGINLAEEFPLNPFTSAFKKVDEAVAAKQEFETKEIKQIFRSESAKTDMEGTATKAEEQREPLAQAIKTAFVPVMHVIRIDAE